MSQKYQYVFLSYILSLLCSSCSAKNGNKITEELKIDTLVINNHTLYIDSISEKEYNNRFEAVKIISYDSTPVKKDKSELILRLEGNKKIVLKDSLSKSDNIDQVTYTYVGFFKTIGFYVVIAQYYETGEYLLINYKTGAMTKVWGLPKLSPNQKRFVCFSDAVGYDIMPNGVQMWEIYPNGELNLEWEYSQETWAPKNIIWANDKSIYVVKSIPDFLSLTKREETSYISITLK
jgi:hypothetical protein